MISNRENFSISLRKSKRSHLIQVKRIKYENNLTKIKFFKFLNKEICAQDYQTKELLLKF
jgi:hypothetical protein